MAIITREDFEALCNRLNEVTDQASGIVREVEQFLKDSGVGIPYSLLIDSPEFRSIDYKRTGGEFRVTLTSQDGGWKAWQNCTRDAKLTTIKYLPELLESIFVKAEVLLKEAGQNVVTIQLIKHAIQDARVYLT